MKAPRNESMMPQGGWKYKDPATGVVVEDNHLGAVMSRVRRAWLANDVEPPPMWEEMIKDQLCLQNPSLDCIEVGMIERVISMDDIMRFAKTAKNWLDGGGKWVEPEESNRRAATCAKCPQNIVVHGCWGCQGAIKWLAERVGMPPATTSDEQLQSCKACGCYNKVAVHMPLEAMDVTGVEFPEGCWKKPSI
jgi:hypothetical protein